MTSKKTPETSGQTMTGGCQCGAVRYQIELERILTLYCCHCRECQLQSASAFAMSLKIMREDFELISGELATWQRVAESGRINRANFCSSCGVRVFHDGGPSSEMVSLKAGLLDEIGSLEPVGHIWCRSALTWTAADEGLFVYPTQPRTYDALIAEWRTWLARRKAAASD